MNPFALSTADYNQFINEVGGSIGNLPAWGAIVQWRGRYILVFWGADYTLHLTDISGGIPDSSAPGGMIPAASIVATSTSQDSLPGPVTAFIYSIPSNFMQVAREDAVSTAGVIGSGIVDSFPVTLPLLAVGLAVVLIMYGPKMKR